MKNSKIQAILWDVDGVIIDTEVLHAQVESETAKRFGIEITPSEVTKKYYGVPIEEEFKDMVKKSGKSVSVEQLLKKREEIFKEKVKLGIPPIPHSKEVLRILSKIYKMAYVSNGEKFYIEPFFTSLGIMNFFKAGIDRDNIKESKPSPQPYLSASALLEVDPSRAVVIEDSEPGFKSAKAAGMILIAYKADHNRGFDFSLADFVVDDLRKIPEILTKVEKSDKYLI